MTVFTRPPHFEQVFLTQHRAEIFDPIFTAANMASSLLLCERDYLQTHDLTIEERTAIGLKLLEKEMKILSLEAGNGVLLCGPPAAGKTGLAHDLCKRLGYMRHTPTDILMQKGYDIPTPANLTERDPMEQYLSLLQAYAYSRIRGISIMGDQLSEKRAAHKFNQDEVVIGGAIQSFVSLCAYFKAYEINPQTGALELPEPLLNILLLLMKKWTPRFLVYVDAPIDERLERAREQAKRDPIEWEKRILPFEHDQELRELTITTLQRIKRYARQHGQNIHLAYYPTSENSPHNIDGFISVFSPETLAYFIERRQEHPTGMSRKDEVALAHLEGTWGDEAPSLW